MAKRDNRYVCQECGAVHAKWMGKCEACGAWNTVIEEAAPEAVPKGASAKGGSPGKGGNSQGRGGASAAPGGGSSDKSAKPGGGAARQSPEAGSNLGVLHSNGMKEEISSDIYEMRDARGRTIVKRRANSLDRARLRRLLQ